MTEAQKLAARKRRIHRQIERLDDPHENVSKRAEQSLIRYYGAAAFEELVVACDHPNPSVRFRAVWALGFTEKREAFDTILRLTSDSDERVSYDSTLALGNLGTPEALAALIEMLPESDVHHPVAQALRKMGPEILPKISEFLNHPDANVRGAILALAADHGDRDLVAKFTHDEDPEIQEQFRYYCSENKWDFS